MADDDDAPHEHRRKLDRSFEVEIRERLSALEQLVSTTEHRLVDHHAQAQHLQKDSGIYNGRLEAFDKSVIRLEERVRGAEAVQIAREARLKPLEDDLAGRVALKEADERTKQENERRAHRTANIIRILIGIAGVAIGFAIRHGY